MLFEPVAMVYIDHYFVQPEASAVITSFLADAAPVRPDKHCNYQRSTIPNLHVSACFYAQEQHIKENFLERDPAMAVSLA